MRRINRFLFILICLSAFVLSGCRSTQKSRGSADSILKTDIRSMQFLRHHTPYLNAKLRLSMDVDGKSLSTTGTMKIVRGEGMQIGVTAMGLFEVARFEMYPSEAQFINKINKEYALLRYCDIPFLGAVALDYSILEALFLNEPFVSGGEDFEKALNRMSVVKLDGQYQINVPEKHDIRYSFFVDALTGELVKTQAFYKNISVDCKYSDFEKAGEYTFPRAMNITIDGLGKKVNIAVKFSNLRNDTLQLKKSNLSGYKELDVTDMLKQLNK